MNQNRHFLTKNSFCENTDFLKLSEIIGFLISNKNGL